MLIGSRKGRSGSACWSVECLGGGDVDVSSMSVGARRALVVAITPGPVADACALRNIAAWTCPFLFSSLLSAQILHRPSFVMVKQEPSTPPDGPIFGDNAVTGNNRPDIEIILKDNELSERVITVTQYTFSGSKSTVSLKASTDSNAQVACGDLQSLACDSAMLSLSVGADYQNSHHEGHQLPSHRRASLRYRAQANESPRQCLYSSPRRPQAGYHSLQSSLPDLSSSPRCAF